MKTNNEILENNWLIAEFYPTQKVDNGTGELIDVIEIVKAERVRSLLYHTSYDWLMPVVEKIEGLRYENFTAYVEISSCWCEIKIANSENKSVPIIQRRCSTKIEAIYRTVIQFIKWYNKQKAS